MGTVLIVDDLSGNRRLLESLLRPDGHVVRTATDGAEAVRAVQDAPPDLVLMDVVMPTVNGFEACRAIKQARSSRLIPVVLVTALGDRVSRIKGIDAGADDFISKPLDGTELRARIRSLLRIKRYTDDLDSAESMILSLALIVEARDPATSGHCQRLAKYATALGRTLGLDEPALSALESGGILHDVGKIGIPDAILLKPGHLTREEYEVMKQHTVIGDRLCADLRLLRKARPIVRHHHERLDGSGYPDGLRGEAIPLLAQIMGIVDVFDALTTPRPYRTALSFASAADALRREAERGWHNPALVDTFVAQLDSPISRSDEVTGTQKKRGSPDVAFRWRLEP